MAIKKETLVKLGYWLIWAAAAYLVFRYVLGWVMPFLLALFTARLIEPCVRALGTRLRLKRGFSAVFTVTLLLGVLGAALWMLAGLLLAQAGDFTKSLPELASGLGTFLKNLEAAVNRYITVAPPEARTFIQDAVSGMMNTVNEIPGRLSGWIFDWAASIAAAAPKIILFFITYVISTYFISASYPQVTDFLVRQIPEKWKSRAQSIKEDFFATLVKWFVAQMKLMFVTFLQLAVALTLLRIPYGILLALLIALIDALPVFGTGTVLIPWALVGFLGGDVPLGVGLALTYGIVSLVRSILEPRFVGGQAGLHPVATLIAMYVGFCTAGVWGMLLFPFGLIMLKHIHDRGYLKLWK